MYVPIKIVGRVLIYKVIARAEVEMPPHSGIVSMLYYYFLSFFFFLVPFLKSFIEFVTILFLSYAFIIWPRGMWDLRFPTRDGTCTLCIGRQNLNHCTTKEALRYFVLRVFKKLLLSD